jgi:enoyl-[acyl-carrier-protein] reductase (NADH)
VRLKQIIERATANAIQDSNKTARTARDSSEEYPFLASEAWSGHITGQTLYVDNGKQGKVMWMPDEC